MDNYLTCATRESVLIMFHNGEEFPNKQIEKCAYNKKQEKNNSSSSECNVRKIF